MTDLFTRRGVCASLLSLGACSTSPDESAPRTLPAGKLTIGTYFVNPPFEYMSDGERVGFEVDLMTEIALRLTLTPVFVDTEWEKILQEMEAGRYDCIVGASLSPQSANGFWPGRPPT